MDGSLTREPIWHYEAMDQHCSDCFDFVMKTPHRLWRVYGEGCAVEGFTHKM